MCNITPDVAILDIIDGVGLTVGRTGKIVHVVSVS